MEPSIEAKRIFARLQQATRGEQQAVLETAIEFCNSNDVNAGALAEQHGIFQYIRRRINIYTHSLDMRLTLQLLRSFSHLQSYKETLGLEFGIIEWLFGKLHSYSQSSESFAQQRSQQLKEMNEKLNEMEWNDAADNVEDQIEQESVSQLTNRLHSISEHEDESLLSLQESLASQITATDETAPVGRRLSVVAIDLLHLELDVLKGFLFNRKCVEATLRFPNCFPTLLNIPIACLHSPFLPDILMHIAEIISLIAEHERSVPLFVTEKQNIEMLFWIFFHTGPTLSSFIYALSCVPGGAERCIELRALEHLHKALQDLHYEELEFPAHQLRAWSLLIAARGSQRTLSSSHSSRFLPTLQAFSRILKVERLLLSKRSSEGYEVSPVSSFWRSRGIIRLVPILLLFTYEDVPETMQTILVDLLNFLIPKEVDFNLPPNEAEAFLVDLLVDSMKRFSDRRCRLSIGILIRKLKGSVKSLCKAVEFILEEFKNSQSTQHQKVPNTVYVSGLGAVLLQCCSLAAKTIGQGAVVPSLIALVQRPDLEANIKAVCSTAMNTLVHCDKFVAFRLFQEGLMDALSSTLLPFASESLQRTGDNSGADEHRHHAAARIDVAFIEWQGTFIDMINNFLELLNETSSSSNVIQRLNQPRLAALLLSTAARFRKIALCYSELSDLNKKLYINCFLFYRLIRKLVFWHPHLLQELATPESPLYSRRSIITMIDMTSLAQDATSIEDATLIVEALTTSDAVVRSISGTLALNAIFGSVTRLIHSLRERSGMGTRWQWSRPDICDYTILTILEKLMYRMLLNTESAASMTLLCNPTAEMLSSSESLAEHIIRELAPYRKSSLSVRRAESPDFWRHILSCIGIQWCLSSYEKFALVSLQHQLFSILVKLLLAERPSFGEDLRPPFQELGFAAAGLLRNLASASTSVQRQILQDDETLRAIRDMIEFVPVCSAALKGVFEAVLSMARSKLPGAKSKLRQFLLPILLKYTDPHFSSKIYQTESSKGLVRERFFDDIKAVMMALNPAADELLSARFNVQTRSRYIPTGLMSLSSRREGLLVRPSVDHGDDSALIERIEVEKLLENVRVSNRHQGHINIFQKQNSSVLETMSKDTKLSMYEWVDAEIAFLLQSQE